MGRTSRKSGWLWRDPHATVSRLFTSRHVRDLQMIIYSAFFLFFVACLIARALGGFLALLAPLLTVFGAVLAWAYQVGSARLGVVDLFACEIATLCRVAAVVDTARRSIDTFSQGPPEESSGSSGLQMPGHHFTSQENYFPVFESNSRDLQALDAKVVINITAFYTFMKAVRDSLRTLAEIRPDRVDLDSPSNKSQAAGSWHKGARNVIYLLFLGLESARRAIADLVEFEPEKAERTIVVLLSELEAYRFLRSQFEEETDVYHQRIMLRAPEYRQLVPELCHSVEAGRALEKTKIGKASWEEAWVLLPELQRRFQAAM